MKSIQMLAPTWSGCPTVDAAEQRQHVTRIQVEGGVLVELSQSGTDHA